MPLSPISTSRQFLIQLCGPVFLANSSTGRYHQTSRSTNTFMSLQILTAADYLEDVNNIGSDFDQLDAPVFDFLGRVDGLSQIPKPQGNVRFDGLQTLGASEVWPIEKSRQVLN